MSDRSEGPADALLDADLRRAVRSLLRTPLLHADSAPDELALIRRHGDRLTRIFAEGLGYRLILEPGLARLVKTGGHGDATAGLRRRNGAPFTPRRYALLALTLAALTQARRQVMIDELVAAVRSAAVDAQLDLDLDAIGERRALHSALVALIDLGVLSERDGDLEHWVERRTESLLDVHRDRLAVLLATPLAGLNEPDDLLRVAAVPSAAGGARVAIRRTLAERPLLSIDDLTPEQLGWWRRNRERERDWFARNLGLELEIRAEGAVAIDRDGDLSDFGFPGSGSAKHLALLLLGELVDVLRADATGDLAGTTWAPVARSTARAAADRVLEQWRTGLRKAYRDSAEAAFDDALDVLVQAGLVRVGEAGLLVHAAAARYAPRPQFLAAASASGEESLFAQEDA